MNDSILFLALATIFGAAMFVVGWVSRTEGEDWRLRREIDQSTKRLQDMQAQWFRDHPRPEDSAGA